MSIYALAMFNNDTGIEELDNWKDQGFDESDSFDPYMDYINQEVRSLND